MPAVKPGDWIHLGDIPGRDAVVVGVRLPEHVVQSGDIEVIYLDDRDRAINVDVKWTGDLWVYAHEFVDGGYADRYDRLREFVRILRRGRYG